MLLQLDDNLAEFFASFNNLNDSYLQNNTIIRDYFFNYYLAKLNLKRNNYENAEIYLWKLDQTLPQLIDPNMKYERDLLYASILLKAKKYDQLQEYLEEKLNKLKTVGKQKNLLYKFKII